MVGVFPTTLAEGGFEVPSDESEPCTSFDSAFSSTALCKECCGVFCISYILDGCCPYCGCPGAADNLVVSKHGHEASVKLAYKFAEQLKNSRKNHVITDEEIYEEDY